RLLRCARRGRAAVRGARIHVDRGGRRHAAPRRGREGVIGPHARAARIDERSNEEPRLEDAAARSRSRGNMFLAETNARRLDDGTLRFHLPGFPRAHYLIDRKSTRLNSSHVKISYAVFCLKKK